MPNQGEDPAKASLVPNVLFLLSLNQGTFPFETRPPVQGPISVKQGLQFPARGC
jgi:hypothetical protein